MPTEFFNKLLAHPDFEQPFGPDSIQHVIAWASFFPKETLEGQCKYLQYHTLRCVCPILNIESTYECLNYDNNP